MLMNDVTHLTGNKTHLFTAENVRGEAGRGGMAVPFADIQPEAAAMGQLPNDSSYNARELGQKWKIRPCITLAPNSETKLVDFDGSGRITHIWITFEARYFRDLILRMYWDGETTPSVEVPIGDFFCSGWKKALKITSIPINVNPTGAMNCFFPMPFRKKAVVTVESRLPENMNGFFYAISVDEGEVAPDEAYFHAQFRRTNPGKYKDDYTIVDGIEGKGHYVGTSVSWQQNTNGWWGEGEVKAFIDGDGEFPTYCGTGTEDYFGGAWSFNENFSAPFFGYQDTSTLPPDNRATNTTGNRHSMYRFHVADPIRFSEKLRVTIQTIGWRSEGRFLPLQDDISSVAYWYQTEPHNPFPKLGSRDELEII